MGDDVELDEVALARHRRDLAVASGTFDSAAAAADSRLGGDDLGALFAAWLTPAVNIALGVVAESVAEQRDALAAHAADLGRTLEALRAADEIGARQVRRAAPP